MTWKRDYLCRLETWVWNSAVLVPILQRNSETETWQLQSKNILLVVESPYSSLFNLPNVLSAYNCCSRARLAARASSSSTWIGDHSGKLQLEFPFLILVRVFLKLWKWGLNCMVVKSSAVPAAAKMIAYLAAPSWPPAMKWKKKN